MSISFNRNDISNEENQALRDDPSQASLNNSREFSEESSKLQNNHCNSKELYLQIQRFIQKSLSIKSADLKKTYKKLRKLILTYERSQQEKLSKPFSLDLLEHSHYIYSLKHESTLMTQEDIRILELRVGQFDYFNYPQEEMYSTLLKTFQFLSHLMTKWNLFNIYNYNYRYRGRSLTVKMIDMIKINQQYLAPDIIWFSYAIKYQPFLGKIDNSVLSYAGILQYELNKVLDFFKDSDLENTDFKVYSKWKFYKKTQPDIQKLYNLLKSVEVAYKYFEKHLIQTLIKLT